MDRKTVIRARELLKDEGLVYSAPGQGFHVTGKTGLPRAGRGGLVVAAEVLVTGGGFSHLTLTG